MVCIMCLLPLFLVPIVNLLPLLFDIIMAKVYGLFGWEYRKPERAPPACPYKPPASKDTNGTKAGAVVDPSTQTPVSKSMEVGDSKED